MDKPFIYIFISHRIRKSTRSDLVNKDFLREQLGRILIRAGGIPKFMIKYIIEDLVKYKILDKLNKTNLYRLNKVDEEKQLNFLD